MHQSLLLLCILVVTVVVVAIISIKTNKEEFIAPYYLNSQKLLCDYYPKTNGTIYGKDSHLFSGFPYYPKAY